MQRSMADAAKGKQQSLRRGSLTCVGEGIKQCQDHHESTDENIC